MSPRRAISVVALALVFCVASARGQNKTDEDFPLTPGTYWVYQGLVRWWFGKSGVTQVTWKTSVTRVIHRDGLTIAVVKGLPGDLDWSDGHVKPALSILIRTPDAKFYLIEDDEAKSALREMDNPKYDWSQILDVDDWFLQLPLAQGKKFCDDDGMHRDDDKYCWVTGPAHSVSLTGVKGVRPGKRVAYRVEYLELVDDDEFDFVPGVGMVTYGYHHHGSIADTELHLVEFHAGDPAP